MTTYAENLAAAEAAVASARAVYDRQNLTVPSDLPALYAKQSALRAAEAHLAAVLSQSDTGAGDAA